MTKSLTYHLIILSVSLSFCLFVSLFILSQSTYAYPGQTCWSDNECSNAGAPPPFGPEQCVNVYVTTTPIYDPTTGQLVGYDYNWNAGTCSVTVPAGEKECYACNVPNGIPNLCQRYQTSAWDSCGAPNNCNACSGGGSGTPTGPTICSLTPPTVQSQPSPYSNTYQTVTASGTCKITITHQIDNDATTTAWPGGKFGNPTYLSDSAIGTGWVSDYTDDATSNFQGKRKIYYTDAGAGVTINNSGNTCGPNWNGWFENDWSASSGSDLTITTTGNNTANRPHYMGYSLQASGCTIAPSTDPTNCSATIPFAWNGGNANDPSTYTPGVAVCGEGLSYGACTPNSWGVGFGTTMDTSSTFPSKDTSWGSVIGTGGFNAGNSAIDPVYQYRNGGKTSGTNPTDYDETNTKTFELAYCGNGVCDSSPTCGGETPANCPQDCSNVTGALNAPTCSAITGWAYDPSNPSSPVSVDIFDENGGLATVTADLPGGSCPGNNCAFSYTPGKQLLDGSTHQISAEAFDLSKSATAGVWLSGSDKAPQPLTCSNPPKFTSPATAIGACNANPTPPPADKQGSPKVTITWTSNLNYGAGDYAMVYRYDPSGNPVLISPSYPPGWQFDGYTDTDPNLLPQSGYVYRVYLFRAGGGGVYDSGPIFISNNGGLTPTCDDFPPTANATTAGGCILTSNWSGSSFPVSALDDTTSGCGPLPVANCNQHPSGVKQIFLQLWNANTDTFTGTTYSSIINPVRGQKSPWSTSISPSGTPTKDTLYNFRSYAVDYAGNGVPPSEILSSASGNFYIDDTCKRSYFQTQNGDVHANSNSGGINVSQ